MADISVLARLLNGALRNVDLTNNTPVVLSIKVGGVTNTELTKAILDNLITLQNGSDVAASLHHHDGRYFTETELGAVSGVTGSDRIGDDDTYTNITPTAATVKGALEGIDAALAATADEKVKVSANDTTPGYLNGKLVAGTGIQLTENNDGSNETLTVASTITQYTDEMAQDAVGGALVDSSTIDFTYNDAGNSITAAVIPGGIDHGALAGLGDDDHTIYTKADGSRAFTGNQSMGGFKITSLGAPTVASDAATKGYVDNALEGLKPKEAVRAATTANITLSGAQTIDGVSIVAGNRVLVKDQTAAENNGIYVAAAGAWSRATDFDSLSPIDEINKAYVAVQEGTAHAGKLYVQYGTVATLGTDPINFTFFNSVSGLTGGDGITVSGSNISVDHDGEGLVFVATQLALELDGSTLSKSASGLKVAAGGITNTEVNAAAAIAYSKLNLSASIVNADIAAAAAISLSKLAALTADRALQSNASTGVIEASAVTNTELGRLSGVTGNIQTQLGNKANITLDNLGATAINTSLVSDTDVTDDLGSTSKAWQNVYANKYIGNGTLPSRIDMSNQEVNIETADRTGATGAKSIVLRVGMSNGSGQGGDVNLYAGTNQGSGNAGSVNINAGASSVSGFTAGNLNIKGGDADAVGAIAGSLNITGGYSYNTTSGPVVIKSGPAYTSGATGDVTLGTGNAGGAGNSGNINLTSGTSVSGTRGKVVVNALSLDMSSKNIINVLDPVNAQDAATKNYVDSVTALKSSIEVAGEAFSASTIYAIRYGQNAETAGRMYKADKDASSTDNFYVVGLVKTSGALSAADPMPAITKVGLLTATSHGFTVGKPIYLTASGALSSTAPSAVNEAVVKVGMAKDANTIDVQIQVMGIN